MTGSTRLSPGAESLKWMTRSAFRTRMCTKSDPITADMH